MTREEIDTIKFKMVFHLTMEGYHDTTYQADVPFSLFLVKRVPMQDYFNESPEPIRRRTKQWYILNGKIIKTRSELYKELEKC